MKSKKMFTQKGILNFIKQNVQPLLPQACQDTLTQEDWERFLKLAFQQTAKTRIFIRDEEIGQWVDVTPKPLRDFFTD